ncbi:MAG: formate/nitrite transporter family protein, partial [Bacteroidota bacterium]
MSESDTLRGVLDQAESGAPAAGHAVRDIFSTDEIFRRIVATADEEFQRSGRLLFLSGLAAGLSIGLSLLARATMTAHAGGGDEAILIGNLLYPVGFLLIVLGRYQLFTENPLTPVTLVMTRIASIPLLLRVWGIVLVANLMGAAIAALMFTKTSVMEPKAMDAAIKFGNHALEYGWQT